MHLGQLAKTVLSHFPWNPVDKGQTWEAPTVCGLGEDTGGLRAGPNLPLSMATRSVQTSEFRWGTMRMALSFQEAFPDPTAATPCPREAPSTEGNFEYTFPGTAPTLGAFSHCKVSSFIFLEH